MQVIPNQTLPPQYRTCPAEGADLRASDAHVVSVCEHSDHHPTAV